MRGYQDGASAGLMSAFRRPEVIMSYNAAGVSSDEGIDRYLRPIVVDPTGDEIGGPRSSSSPRL
jgi:hypothetical protein